MTDKKTEALVKALRTLKPPPGDFPKHDAQKASSAPKTTRPKIQDSPLRDEAPQTEEPKEGGKC